MKLIPPKRVYRLKGKDYKWHINDPQYDPKEHTVSCCGRGCYDSKLIEWADMSDLVISDKFTLCSVCFRPFEIEEV